MSDHLPYVVCLRTQHSIKKVARSIEIKPTTIYLTKILMQTVQQLQHYPQYHTQSQNSTSKHKESEIQQAQTQEE